jgi:hypothetical protein
MFFKVRTTFVAYARAPTMVHAAAAPKHIAAGKFPCAACKVVLAARRVVVTVFITNIVASLFTASQADLRAAREVVSLLSVSFSPAIFIPHSKYKCDLRAMYY